MNRAVQLIRLNARVAVLAARGRWLGRRQVAQGYDAAAPTYNDSWQRRLRPVTDELLDRIPKAPYRSILDLGCGTGYATQRLADTFSQSKVTGVDVSEQMLEVARRQSPPNATFAQADMLTFVQQSNQQTADLIISTWALGYSNYKKLFPACLRILQPGGILAFIVNYADTLRPVFSAFEHCMLRFPERVKLAAWPRFPKKWAGLETALEDSGFTIVFHRDGEEKIELPPTGIAEWLRGTGILSGFDQMMDLTGTAGEFLEQEINRSAGQVFHHYAMVIAGKTGGPV